MIWIYFAFLGRTLGVIGTVLIAFTAIAVHQRVAQEQKIDKKVFKVMHRERRIAIWGIFLIALGYILEIPFLLPIFS